MQRNAAQSKIRVANRVSTSRVSKTGSNKNAPQIAIFAVFFIQAMVFGSWLPRIAGVKASLGLSEGQLGFVLLALPTGTFTALSIAAPIVKRYPLARTLLISLVVWVLAFVLAAASTTAAALAIALVCCGLVMGLLEIASNIQADSIEQSISKRIMSRCHGFWSLGAMTGALLSGPVFAHNGVGVLKQFLLLVPVVTIASVFATRMLSERTTATQRSPAVEGSTDVNASSSQRVPLTLPVFMMCLIPLGIMALEGSFMDWSAVFMREQLGTDARVAGYTFAVFAAVMALVRLAGDWIAEQFGDALVVRLSGITAAAGVGLFALATNVPVALMGAALAGSGVAIVYPLTVSAVARANEAHREENVAYLSIAAFSVMMLSPPLIGGIAELFSLRISLFMLVPGALVTALLANQLRS